MDYTERRKSSGGKPSASGWVATYFRSILFRHSVTFCSRTYPRSRSSPRFGERRVPRSASPLSRALRDPRRRRGCCECGLRGILPRWRRCDGSKVGNFRLYDCCCRTISGAVCTMAGGAVEAENLRPSRAPECFDHGPGLAAYSGGQRPASHRAKAGQQRPEQS